MEAYLGYPNWKIRSAIEKRHKKPVLKMTSTNGTVCEFDYEQVPLPLVYSYVSGVKNPFNLCSDISSTKLLVSVDDTENRISAIGYGTYDYGFMYCSNLSSINCKNVISVALDAFHYCVNLISVDFPNILSIDSLAFYGCPKLTSVNCPKIKMFGAQVFSGGTKTLSILNMSSISEIPVTHDLAFQHASSTGISCYVPTALVSQFESSWGTKYPGTFNFIGV